jgi:hypothetical protein
VLNDDNDKKQNKYTVIYNGIFSNEEYMTKFEIITLTTMRSKRFSPAKALKFMKNLSSCKKVRKNKGSGTYFFVVDMLEAMEELSKFIPSLGATEKEWLRSFRDGRNYFVKYEEI